MELLGQNFQLVVTPSTISLYHTFALTTVSTKLIYLVCFLWELFYVKVYVLLYIYVTEHSPKTIAMECRERISISFHTFRLIILFQLVNSGSRKFVIFVPFFFMVFVVVWNGLVINRRNFNPKIYFRQFLFLKVSSQWVFRFSLVLTLISTLTTHLHSS